jgi:hypothetical protein
MYKINGCGAEEAPELPARLVLRDLEDADEVFLAVVRKPDLSPISEDRHDHRQKDATPAEQRETADGVPQNPERADCAPSTCACRFRSAILIIK